MYKLIGRVKSGRDVTIIDEMRANLKSGCVLLEGKTLNRKRED